MSTKTSPLENVHQLAVEELLQSVRPPTSITVDMEPPIAAYVLWLMCSTGIPPWSRVSEYGISAEDVRGLCLYIADQLPEELRTDLPPKRRRRDRR